GLIRRSISYAHQNHRGISSSDADVTVSYDIPIWGVLSPTGSAGMDEYLDEDQSGYLWHRPNPPGNTGSITGLALWYHPAWAYHVTLE
ncbi:unnamed protein product, partial [marine sediment metagenome]